MMTGIRRRSLAGYGRRLTLAFPFSGGAVTLIFRASPSQPTISFRDDPGTAFTLRRVDGFGSISTVPRNPSGVRSLSATQKRLRIRLTLRSQEVAGHRTVKAASPSKHQAVEGLTTSYGLVLALAKKALAPRVGLEPTTCRLTAGRSTIELSGNSCRDRTSLTSNLPQAVARIEMRAFLSAEKSCR